MSTLEVLIELQVPEDKVPTVRFHSETQFVDTRSISTWNIKQIVILCENNISANGFTRLDNYYGHE